MKTELLEVLACPKCHGKVRLDNTIDEITDYLVCDTDKLGFRVEDGIPVLLIAEAKEL